MSDATRLALDIGGTDLKAARVTRAGVLQAFDRRPSRAGEGAEALLDAVSAAHAALGSPRPGLVVGVGCPGVVDPRDGALIGTTPHLALPPDHPLGTRIAERLGSRVSIDNDANRAALAEHRIGAARGCRVSVTVTIGTGVGCGIVVDGVVLRGAHGGAGELGHLPLGSDGPPCGCGVPGCLEPWSGGSGMAARARELGADIADARAVFASEDERVRAVRTRGIEALARQLACAVAVLDPEVIVLGGGVAQASERLFAPLRESFERFLLPAHRGRIAIVPALLGDRAGVIGAGLAAWDASDTGAPAERT